jgi:hypothetical protein
MIDRFAVALVVGLPVLAPAVLVSAQSAPGTTPAPSNPAATASPVNPAKPTYEVKGFRSAVFGMTEAEVRAAIQKDFAAKPENIRQTANAVERTTALVVSLSSLEPGPGPATVVYILGFQSKKLIQVNVLWARDPKADPKANAGAEAGAYFLAGVQLANYFGGFSWSGGRVHVGIAAGPGTILLFGAEDDRTGAVQVVADGFTLERKPDGQVEAVPQGGGLASIRVSYIANRTKPDIFKLEPGRF